MGYSNLWLPAALRAAGLTVHEVTGWQNRGRGDLPHVRGIVCHHTAGPRDGDHPSLDTIIRGRSDLAGPLAQLLLARSGEYWVVAAGRANHGGKGTWPFHKAGIGPNQANLYTIGIEAENVGQSKFNVEPWPEAQLDAYKRGVAVICKHFRLDPMISVAGHKEYAPSRKSDPCLIDMSQFRKDVKAIMDKNNVGVGETGSSVPSA